MFCPTISIICTSSETKLITKYLYNFDPLKPHFYIVKLGFAGVYIIFLISAQKHRLWVLIRTASAEAVLTSTHNLYFEQKYEKYKLFLSENLQFLEVKFSVYLNRRVFLMCLGVVNSKTGGEAGRHPLKSCFYGRPTSSLLLIHFQKLLSPSLFPNSSMDQKQLSI